MRYLTAAVLLFVVMAQAAAGDDLDIRQPDDSAASQGIAEPGEAIPERDGQQEPSLDDSIAGLGTAANPAAVNITVGNGMLGRWFGIDEDSGWRVGGVWVGDATSVPTGGLDPGKWGLNSLAIVDVSVDAEKSWGWQGTSFGTQYLNFAGQPTNILAGTVQGLDGLQAAPPFNRSELYQLWWRQTWFDNKLITRIGKSVPSYDFNNVLAPDPVSDDAYGIPAVSGLIYTPIFVNPTMLGRLPGYYDSASGLTATWAPNERFYMSYGFYDGNAAHGDTTGTLGPQFTGYYFHIGEVGTTWQCGCQNKPGKLGVGVWGQTGPLQMPSGGTINGDMGAYLFGSQRLWFRRPGKDNSGISGFVQYGANNSDSMLVRQYFGCGLTAFGMVRSRPKDSQGVGLAWSFLNNDPGAGQFFFKDVSKTSTQLRSNELMLASYYQASLWDGAFFQPTLTYIPNPGIRDNLPGALGISMYLITLF